MKKYVFPVLVLLALGSCSDSQHKSHGPIVLGDSATIVTEKDKSRLQDIVTDFRPNLKKEEEKKDTVPQPAQASAKSDTIPRAPTANTTPASLPNVAGLKAEFKETTFLLPNINAKQSGNPNLQNANGAVYTWINGIINGNVLHTTGNVLKVSQRYISVVAVKGEFGTLPLETMSKTTDWEAMKGGNGSYPVTGLEGDQMDFTKGNNAQIQNAIARSCQRRHISRKKMEEWQDLADKVKASNQKPMIIMLRSVMWKIDGKDANGRPFSKQIRIDIPI